VLAACGFNLRKLYAVFLLPILKWLKNQITEKYFHLYQQLDFKSFIITENK
jgi:outer membrane lipopolysaccharide assembly protein LptE/RlpB